MPRPGRYALDINIVVAVLNGEPDVLGLWDASEDVLLLAPVLGELIYGAGKSGSPQRNEERIRDIARLMTFVPCDEAVCERYGALKAELARIGRPLPDNDLWVAACAAAAGAVLVTRDAHFETVSGLARERW